jgi:spore coat polysaccharide biosynthesis protein SpsF
MARVKRTVALVQARMSSKRLPGKVLLEIAGKPMLLWVMERLGQARTLDASAVITSVHEEDDALERLCAEHGIACFRGSLDDVLDRYYRAALFFKAEVVVRVTADCPLLDPAVTDRVVRYFNEGAFDYASNVLHPTYPDGLDTEVFRFEALERGWQEASLNSEREHVTAFIYKHPDLFRLGGVEHGEDLSSLRWTVDTEGDLQFVRAVYDRLKGTSFSMTDVVELVKANSEITGLNAGQQRNEGYQASLKADEEEG